MSSNPSRSTHSIRFRGREGLILLADDEAAYFRILADKFVGLRFWDDISHKILQDRTQPPRALPLHSISECQGRNVDFFFDPNWQPRWTWNEELRRWDQGRMPFPLARFERISGASVKGGEDSDSQAESRPSLGVGRVYFRIYAGNQKHEATARKALRLLGNIASSKNLMAVYTETLEIFDTNTRNAPLVGHHARRWCLDKPNRLLSANPGLDGWGYRPKPEGFVPPNILAPPPNKNPAILRARAESESIRREPISIVRSRGWFATPADERALADLLIEIFPGIRFIDRADRLSADRPEPDIRPQSALADCSKQEVHFVFDPSWELQWKTVWIVHDYRQWTYGALPLPNGTIFRRCIDPVTKGRGPQPLNMAKTNVLRASWIYIRVQPGNKKHDAIARKVFDLIGAVATRKGLVRIDNKTFRIIDDNLRRTPWVGNDARRWCLEAPDRRLDSWGSGYAGPVNSSYRPRPPVLSAKEPAARRKKKR